MSGGWRVCVKKKSSEEKGLNEINRLEWFAIKNFDMQLQFYAFYVTQANNNDVPTSSKLYIETVFDGKHFVVGALVI